MGETTQTGSLQFCYQNFQPSYEITLMGAAGAGAAGALLTIHRDGRVEAETLEAASEAGRAFVDAVRHALPLGIAGLPVLRATLHCDWLDADERVELGQELVNAHDVATVDEIVSRWDLTFKDGLLLDSVGVPLPGQPGEAEHD